MLRVIGFTGHRNKRISSEDMFDILEKYCRGYEVLWLHGGAAGFDEQVHNFAVSHGVRVQVFHPDYEHYEGQKAPLVRDKNIVDLSNFIIACYDGRGYGGTKYTIEYARKRHKEVIVYTPEEIQ